jgi:ABC-2 type transport system ATP-binding protein
MRKKIGLATALLHAPKLLVLDEPFEAVDPVSASTIRTILPVRGLRRRGGAVQPRDGAGRAAVHHVAVITRGRVVAAGAVADVRGGGSLEEAFVHIVGGRTGGAEGLSWLAS